MSLVFTNDNCIGCNKCIRVCPCPGACVAVTEEDGTERIQVDPAKCIGCGACMDACKHGAREFEDDTEQFFADLAKGEKISILLAPAFKANYPGDYERVLGGLKNLGVNRIISVSFGAVPCRHLSAVLVTAESCRCIGVQFVSYLADVLLSFPRLSGCII